MSVLKSAGLAKSIDELRRTATGGGGRGGRSAQIFVKPDSSIKFRFLTEPTGWMEYQEHYDAEKKKFVPAIDNDPLDSHPVERTRQTSRRWLANILNLEDGRVHIVKLNGDQVQRLLTRYQRYSTVMDRAYEIIREGSGRDSKYSMDQDDPVQMDLANHFAKMHDLEDYLLGEVDEYHGTTFQQDYRESKGEGGGIGAGPDDIEASVAKVEAAAQKVAEADKVEEAPPWTDKDLDDPKLNAAAAKVEELTPTPAAEPPGMAEIAAEVEEKAKLAAVPDPAPAAVSDDPWEVAKNNGQPCVKGDNGQCMICGFDVTACLMKPKAS
jgi:hypothetical protein